VPKDDGHVWTINQSEAEVVRQIFQWSASGYSLKKIAGLLNEAKIPLPQKSRARPHPTWCPTAIREMLRRQLYIGRRIWNKTKYVKRPGTNKRVARPRPRDEWQIQEVPELRIVSDELWTAVQERQQKLKEVYAPQGRPVSRAASSSYLLSGFLRGGICDAKMIIVSGTGKTARYGCPQAWNRRACRNRVSVKARDLECALFQELKSDLLSSGAVDYTVHELLEAQDRQEQADEDKKRTAELKAEIDRLVAAIAAVGHSDALIANLQAREQEVKELEARQKPQSGWVLRT
jgi:site-specific DNA recombinase